LKPNYCKEYSILFKAFNLQPIFFGMISDFTQLRTASYDLGIFKENQLGLICANFAKKQCSTSSFLVRASAWLNMWSCPSVCLPACPFQLAYCLNDQAHIAWFTSGVPRGQLWDRRRPSMEDDLWWKTTFDGRPPLMEDDLWWKDGRRPLMEDDLWWKTTFDGRQPLMEDDFWWKTTFDGRLPLMEDDSWWKTTFDGRRPLMEDDLWWKTTFDGRRPLMEDNLWWKTTVFNERKLVLGLVHVGMYLGGCVTQKVLR